MIRTAALVASFALLGCTHPTTTKTSAPLPAEGKPMAPVAVDAELGAGSGRITVRFETAASEVNVSVNGIEGLSVTSTTMPLAEASAKQGESRSFDVTFTPGPGRSMLVVNVTGTFGGARSTRVVTFDVGTPTKEQLQTPGKVVESGGERVKVLPAQQTP